MSSTTACSIDAGADRAALARGEQACLPHVTSGRFHDAARDAEGVSKRGDEIGDRRLRHFRPSERHSSRVRDASA